MIVAATTRSASARSRGSGREHDLEVLGLLAGIVAILLAVVLAVPGAPGIP